MPLVFRALLPLPLLLLLPFPSPSIAELSPPVELAWVLHVGPLTAQDTYEEVRRERDALLALARRLHARATILVTGDVAEEALARGHGAEWRALVRDGFDVGTRVPLTVRAHLRRWMPADGATRFGERGWDEALARRMWSDHRAWVDRLVGADANGAVDAEPVRCSSEARLARENGLDVSFSRAGAWLARTDEAAPAPWRPAASDEPGRQIASAHDSTLVEVDRSEQVGDALTARGDASVFMLVEAFYRSAAAPGSLRAFGFLTRASVATRARMPDVERLVTRLAAHAEGTPRRARWATATGLRTAFLASEASGSPSPTAAIRALEPLALRLRALHLDAIQRVRAEHGRQPTTRENAELRWWAHDLWREALASTHGARLRAIYPDAERERLARAFAAGADAAWLADFDAVLRRMETLARTRPDER